MQRLILYTPLADESRRLQQAVRSRMAAAGDEELQYLSFADAEAAAREIQTNGATLIGWDVSTEAARRALLPARAVCRSAFLLAIAERDTSPLLFLTPGIGPDSLVLRPVEKGEAERAAAEMAAELFRQAADDRRSFVIHSREGSRTVLYSSIYYFEARGRKIYLRLENQEIGFAGTLEQLETRLPPNFRRTHRSFVVNTDKIDRVLLTENTVVLWNGLSVPLSRSYKKEIKELPYG